VPQFPNYSFQIYHNERYTHNDTLLRQWYGIWGDTNGDINTGEASISLAELCFPKEDLSGDNGHVPQDVLYIGFTGANAAPKGANWRAKNALQFSQSIKAVGDKLVAGL
jgi:chitosanase